MIEKVETKFGSFFGYSQDHLFKCLKSGEFFDNKISEYIKENIRTDDICVDVGANIGFFSVQLSKLCKKVYSFEPQKEVYNLLIDNLSVNDCHNVSALNIALSDKKTNMSFNLIQDDWVGKLSSNYNEISSIGSISLQEDVNGTMEADRLDSVVDNNDNISFCKIDTEGFDIAVILGMEGIIKRSKPTIIFEYNEELSLRNTNKTLKDLEILIQKYNYKLEKLDESNFILK